MPLGPRGAPAWPLLTPVPTMPTSPTSWRASRLPNPAASVPSSSTPACCWPTRRALRRFDEHEVVLPVVVITELEGKRAHPELGYFARSALRLLDELRMLHGRLDRPVPIGDDGGTLRVELNHSDPSVLPAGFRLGDNDTRILAVALNLRAEGADVTLVSKDLPMRVKASSVGLAAEEYRAELAIETGYTGMSEVEVVRRRRRRRCTTTGSLDLRSRARPALPLRAGADLRDEGARSAGSPPTSRCGWSAATARRSACVAGRPSSGSPSTCCSTPTSGSSRSAAAPAPASPRSRCAPGSRRCSSDASTARSWCSGRCSPSAARSSATCPAASRRRCSPGRRRCSTRSAP